ARVIELADLVAGRGSGRINPDQITLYKSLGIGLEDVAAAGAAYHQAILRSIGRIIESEEPWVG
ncbi:MAG: ornithine cyclodeaminase family protein, partial [Candidatus Limnocylindria bacterium]